MNRRSLAVWGGLGAAVLLSVAACTSDHPAAGPGVEDGGERPARQTSSAAPGPAADATTPGTAQARLEDAPRLGTGERLVARQKSTSGNASIAFGKGKKGEALGIAVQCRGEGRIEVAVRSAHVSFPLDCLADEVSSTYNVMAVTGSNRAGVVSVEAPTGVRWSLAVDRGAAPREDRS